VANLHDFLPNKSLFCFAEGRSAFSAGVGGTWALRSHLFVSAILLFSVQPMFTKMILPRLGGAPAVWSVAMVFFQTALLIGYAYAHLLTCATQENQAV